VKELKDANSTVKHNAIAFIQYIGSP